MTHPIFGVCFRDLPIWVNINFKDEKRVRQTYNRRRRELAKRIKELEAELEAQQAAEIAIEPTSEQSTSEQATA